MSAPRTVRVRVAVAVDSEGEWHASGSVHRTAESAAGSWSATMADAGIEAAARALMECKPTPEMQRPMSVIEAYKLSARQMATAAIRAYPAAQPAGRTAEEMRREIGE